MKKLLAMLLVLVLALPIFGSCTYVPPVVDDLPPVDEEEDDYVPDDTQEQTFDSALEAYLFGAEYFASEAPFYETTQFGTATAMGIGTYVMTKRYKSDVSENFLYETNTIGTKIMGIDPTFALKAYKEHDDDTILYARVNGTEVENGAFIDPQYSTPSFKAGTSVYAGVAVQTAQNWQEYQSDVGGNIPDTLTVYRINEDTIQEVLSFEEDKDGYKYVFTFSLNEGAIADYKHQVALLSGQTYFRFNPLELKDGLTVQFCMDKYGRILRMDVNENYTVDTGSAKATVVNTSVEYFSYSKRSEIEILDEEGTFTGPTLTRVENTDDDKVESFVLEFDAQGGSDCDAIDVYFNTEIGTLPTTELEGYLFAGWFTEPNGEGTEFNERTLYEAREDMTLYAYWYFIDPDDEGVYALVSGGQAYMIVEGAQVSGDYSIPATYKDKPIVAIGKDAFRANLDLTSLTIHNKITSIGAGAFFGCTNITSIEFEEDSTLASIGDEAFRNLSKLNGIALPDSLESIGIGAFRNCTNAGFHSVTLPKNVSYLGGSAFYGCTSLAEFTFEKGSKLTVLEDELFRGCTNKGFVSISIPEGITHIGKGVFYGTPLTDVVFEGGNVTAIGAQAFQTCRNLTRIEIPASVVLIDESAFQMCMALNEVVFDGGNLEAIGKNAFTNTALSSLRIPASVTMIGESAFGNISTLASVTFAPGSRLETIGYRAFYNAPQVASLKFPSSLKTIGADAFARASGLTALQSVEFAYGSQLISIGAGAFASSKLASVTIPASVTEIGATAFKGNTALASVVFEAGSRLESIGGQAFEGCTNEGFTSFTVPSGVTSLGGGAFIGTAIEDFTLKTDKFVLKDGVIYTADYKSVVTAVPKLVTAQTTIDARTQSIDAYAFYGAQSLAITSFPASVTSIGERAFYGCIGLSELVLHDGITEIGTYAFYGCENIESLTLPNTLTAVPNYAFYNLKKLTTVTIPSTVTLIGQNSFRGSGLTTVTIPASVQKIDANAFMSCEALAAMTFGEGLAEIGNAAFSSCKALTRIELPASLVTVANSFNSCSKLEEVVVKRWVEGGDEPITRMTANAFASTPTTLKIYVPSGSLDAYKEAANWKTHVAKIEAAA